MSRNVLSARMTTKQQISASTTTAKATNPVGTQTYQVYVFNQNTVGTAYIKCGLTGDTATAANGFPIGFNSGHYLTISPGEYVHALLTTGTATIDVCEMSA